MATTTKGLRYPVSTDRVMDGATAIGNLAADVDAKLPASATGTITLSTGWSAGSETTDCRRVLLVAGTPATYVVTFIFNFVRATGATTLTSTSGNYTDTDMFTLPAGYRPPVFFPITCQVTNKGTVSGRVDPSTGTFTLQDGAAASIAPGDQVRVTATFLSVV